ncbi:putative carboxylic ester hydrolase [Helianthus annuus]|uniref:Carboxylic ester hydrolase n=1 Tax=Helianthus annuus TaxID=4232 RepID=A0A251USR5_HELAN|nr:putative carboxylic ester hydrolase [Helianthus annuus]KAJ0502807.1 putative carboxylic ester hydrolase [Helianthus annuus]KAJ0511011.1 putative carboxylic ester hydrolase [Helianthus annuus]KAJ0518765.1 putative carboxylic ester hydrolase [Helianthus annuus]KAJ0686794.1 putative carboxylic ester hydrolase [Helianthus annuus]
MVFKPLLKVNSSCMNLTKFPLNPAVIINSEKSYSSKPNVTKKIYCGTVTITSLPSSLSSDRVCNNSASLPLNWRDIQGLNNWENLIQPLSPLLQDEIIRYGKFVTACYEAFDLNPNSKRYLNCKHSKNRMFLAVGWGDCGYTVTKYVYATANINVPIQNGGSCARWIGYIAVSSDEEVKRIGRRDILVTFRGTVTYQEWIVNFMSSLSPARLDPNDPKPDIMVEAGFLNLYTSSETNVRFGLGSCREQLLSEISRLLRIYKNEELSITLAGHSMGSSLAMLLAYDIAEVGLKQPSVPLTVFSFAGPRVGNVHFKERCEELGVKVLRIVNANDPITKLPGIIFNESFSTWRSACYAHVGIELVLDPLKPNEDETNGMSGIMIDQRIKKGVNMMEFFKIDDILCVHDMQTYIEMIKNCPRRSRIRRKGVDMIKKLKEMNMTSVAWIYVATTLVVLLTILV